LFYCLFLIKFHYIEILAQIFEKINSAISEISGIYTLSVKKVYSKYRQNKQYFYKIMYNSYKI